MDYSHTALFHTIKPAPTPWTRWLTSLGIHTAFPLGLIVIPVAVHQSVEPPSHYVEVRLVDPRISPPPVIKIKLPQPVAPRTDIRPKRIEVKLAIVLPPPVKRLKPEVFDPPKIEAARAPEPKIELALPAAPMGPKPAAHEVKTGGFGDPEGVPSSTATPKGLILAKMGAFDLPWGPGAGGAGGHSKVVALGGFGEGGVADGSGSSSGRGKGNVQVAGFGDYAAPAMVVAAKTAPSPAPVTPVEITYKPKPAYTAEARQQKLEGEVQLDVVFCANGQIHVVGVLRGLGMGLDESARTAATQIRFRPGTKDGSPVDMRGIVHIVFELS